MVNKTQNQKIVDDITSGPLVDMKQIEAEGPERKRPEWVQKEGFIFVGAWESLTAYRRGGSAMHEAEKIWDFAHSAEFVKDVKKLGCNCLIAHFDYRFGTEAQREDWQLTKKLINLAHKHGLRAGTYFRVDTLFAESVVGRERELVNCVQRDPWGREQSQGPSNWKLLCFHQPEVVKQFEAMIRIAIVEMKSDIMHFDGFMFGGPEPWAACRCEKCKEDFRKFLHERYRGREAVAIRRLGHAFFDHIEPPYNYPDLRFPGGAVMDPLWQEWIEFRCFWTAKLTRHFSGYVHSLNPEVAVEVNFGIAVRENSAAWIGNDLPTAARYCDGLWSEDAYSPAVLPGGELISRIRQCKMARQCDAFAFTYMEGPDDRAVLRNMAHVAAFNGGTIGSLGFAPRMPGDYRKSFAAKSGFVKWLRNNWDYYLGTESASEVAVWRSERSAAFGSDLVAAAAMRVEQLLIEERIPFSIVFDEWLEKCGPEKVLVLANAECVTEPEGRAIEEFARRGGSVLIGQESSLYDGWRRRREDFLLREIMGSEAGRDAIIQTGNIMALGPAGIMTGHEEKRSGGKVFLAKFGQGRVAYVPEIVNASERPSLITPEGRFDSSLDYANWHPPTHKEDVLSALRWLLGAGARFEVDAPRGVVAEYLFQRKKNRYLVHLVNFLGKYDAPIIQVKMRPAPGEKVKRVKVISPDPDGPPRFTWKLDGQRLFVEILNLDLYAVMIIETDVIVK